MHIQPGSLFDKALNNLEHMPLPTDPCTGHAQARAHNFRHDQRATGIRETDYMGELSLQQGTAEEIRERHEFYVKEFVWGGVLPPTFLLGNDAAFLGPLAGSQNLVRMESLDRLLEKWRDLHHLTTIDAAFQFLQKAVIDFHGKSHGDPERTQAVAVLDRLLALWNRIQRDSRPMFATFEDGLQNAIVSTNWEEEVRNRLGLAHIPPRAGGKIPVALMRYPVTDVNVLAGELPSGSSLFAAPTSLDSEIWPYFFPAPVNPHTPRESYGRSMSLTPQPDGSGLIAEVLHVKLNYKMEHIYKLGWLSSPIPNCPMRELRNSHLMALRRETGMNDFGTLIP